MNILSISIIIFCVMELGNGVAVFNAWFDVKKDKNLELFAKYMAYWVAGVKLIFIFLLFVILITGTDKTKMFAVIVMILSIATYFFKLHPIIKELDNMGQITSKGYSKKLGYMIAGFLIMFSLALIIHIITTF